MKQLLRGIIEISAACVSQSKTRPEKVLVKKQQRNLYGITLVINHGELLSGCFSNKIYQRERSEELNNSSCFSGATARTPPHPPPRGMSPSFQMSPRVRSVTPKLECCSDVVPQLWRRLKVDAEGKHTWPFARVCCWNFRGDECYV